MNTTATQNGQQNGPTMWPQVNGALVGNESIGSVSGYLAGLQSPYGMANPVKQSAPSMDTESMMSGYSERSRKTRPAAGNGLYATMSMSNTPTKTANGTLSLNSSMTPLTSASPFAYSQLSQAQTISAHDNGSGQLLQSPFPELYPQPQMQQPPPISHTMSSIAHQQQQLQQQHQQQQQQSQHGTMNKLESPYSISARAEMIQMPEVDLYADNATAITGATSEHSVSFDDLRSVGSKSGKPSEGKPQQWNVWTALPAVLCLAVFLTPILMVVLPRFEPLEIRTKECNTECDGLLIGFCFKLLILSIGCWALFFRRPRASYPRVCQYRAIVMGLLLVLLSTFWLFYSVRIAERRPFIDDDTPTYFAVIQFASSFVDAALFVHYVAVILLEIRQLEPRFVVKIVRSPDGISQSINLGRISIQRAAAMILEHYYHQFPHFNRHLERLREKKQRKNSSRQTSMKIYTIDGPESMGLAGALDMSPKSILAQNTAANAGKTRSMVNGSVVSGRGKDRDTMSQRSGHSGHRSSMDEHEFERRVRKRKFRLVSVTEDAFAHIKKMHEARNGPGAPMDPREAAQAIFPSIAKTLQKYLRVTRQHSRHTMQSIVAHLSTCLNYGLSPKAFLERYFSATPIAADDVQSENWSIVCDTLLSRPIEQGTVFLLKQDDISLLVSVGSLPTIDFTEEFVDPKQNRFVFKHNSETSV